MSLQKTYNIISLVVIAALGIYFICRGGLSGSPANTQVLGETIVVRTDTVIKLHHDTVWQTAYVDLPPSIVTKIDTVYLPGVDSPVKEYSGTAADSTLELEYVAQVKGELLSIDHRYKLLKPETITIFKDRTVTNDTTITVTRYRGGLYLGPEIGYGSNDKAVSFGLGALLTTPGGTAYGYTYDVTRGEHRLGVKYRLVPRRRNTK